MSFDQREGGTQLPNLVQSVQGRVTAEGSGKDGGEKEKKKKKESQGGDHATLSRGPLT